MDAKLQGLRRLSETDPVVKERYIRELERCLGIAEEPEQARQKCLVDNCPNHANEGHGLFLLMQANTPGKAPYKWDEAVGPLFICSPCYRNAKRLRD